MSPVNEILSTINHYAESEFVHISDAVNSDLTLIRREIRACMKFIQSSIIKTEAGIRRLCIYTKCYNPAELYNSLSHCRVSLPLSPSSYCPAQLIPHFSLCLPNRLKTTINSLLF